MTINLGAIESPRDPRDIKLGSVQPPAPFPFRFKPDISQIPRYYQNGQPSCSGHAGAWFKSYLDHLSLGVPIARSPRFIYAICKRDDGIPYAEGTYLRQIFKTLKNAGVCELQRHPNAVELDKDTYRSPSEISPLAFTDASLNKTGTYAQVEDITFSGLQRAIWQNQAVILLIWCDSGFFGTNAPTYTETGKYGHFVVAYGYDDDHIYIVDSTEKDLANSLKYIPRAAVNAGFVREAMTALNIPNWQLKGLTAKNDILRAVLTSLISAYNSLIKQRS